MTAEVLLVVRKTDMWSVAVGTYLRVHCLLTQIHTPNSAHIQYSSVTVARKICCSYRCSNLSDRATPLGARNKVCRYPSSFPLLFSATQPPLSFSRTCHSLDSLIHAPPPPVLHFRFVVSLHDMDEDVGLPRAEGQEDDPSPRAGTDDIKLPEVRNLSAERYKRCCSPSCSCFCLIAAAPFSGDVGICCDGCGGVASFVVIYLPSRRCYGHLWYVQLFGTGPTRGITHQKR